MGSAVTVTLLVYHDVGTNITLTSIVRFDYHAEILFRGPRFSSAINISEYSTCKLQANRHGSRLGVLKLTLASLEVYQPH